MAAKVRFSNGCISLDHFFLNRSVTIFPLTIFTSMSKNVVDFLSKSYRHVNFKVLCIVFIFTMNASNSSLVPDQSIKMSSMNLFMNSIRHNASLYPFALRILSIFFMNRLAMVEAEPAPIAVPTNLTKRSLSNSKVLLLIMWTRSSIRNSVGFC